MWDEYYGFPVTGGGFDAYGSRDSRIPEDMPPWHCCRVRLSPARKELLVKVDVMLKPNLEQLWPPEFIMAVMDSVSEAFSERVDGCGARLYYLMRTEVLHTVPLWTKDYYDLFASVPDPKGMLSEYVHLIFGDYLDEFFYPWVTLPYAKAGTMGAFIATGLVLRDIADPEITGFSPEFWSTLTNEEKWIWSYLLVSHVVSHELTHLLFEVPDEDCSDLNCNGVPDESADKQYLMYPFVRPEGCFVVRFANKTRAELDLTSKESVERRPVYTP